MKSKAAAQSILAVALAMVACSSEHSIKNISLEMRSTAEFVLNGKTIKSNELRNALDSLAAPEGKVCVTVSAAKSISYADVRALMREIQNTGISCVGVVGIDG